MFSGKHKRIGGVFLASLLLASTFFFFGLRQVYAQTDAEREVCKSELLSSVPGYCSDGAINARNFNSNTGSIATAKSGVQEDGAMLFGLALKPIREFAALLFGVSLWLFQLMTSEEVYSEVFLSPQAKAGINTGWGLLRDFVNVFYIFILLLIAISTILRINKFGDKGLLVKVVASAVLVNFSKPIALAVFDFSQLAMEFFLKAWEGKDLGTEIADKMQFSKIYTAGGMTNLTTFVEIVFTVILAVMIFVLAISLVVRMLAFFILTILSPLAFFSMAVPGHSQINAWFNKLFAWAMYGPIMMFFIWLAFVMLDAITKAVHMSPTAKEEQAATFNVDNGFDSTIIGGIGILLPFIVVIYFLYYGYAASKSMASKAGNAALNSLMNKGEAWMKKGQDLAVGVGSLGMVPAAVGAGKWAQKQPGRLAGAAKTVAGGFGRGLVKGAKRGMGIDPDKTLEDRAKEKAADLEARMQGGKIWEEHEEKKLKKSVADLHKEWDEPGSSVNLDDKIANGTKEEKIAAAMKKAKDGKMTDFKEYEDTMEMLNKTKGAKGFKANFEKNTKEKNLDVVLDYNLRKSGDKDKNREKIANEAIKQENDLRKIKNNNSLNTTEENKYKAEERYAFRHIFDQMELKDFKKQSPEFHKSTDFKRYMDEQLSPGGKYTKNNLRNFANKNLDALRKAIWEAQGFI